MPSDTLRTFFAIKIPKETLKQIDSALIALRGTIGSSVRWVRTELLHITLQFIGEFNTNHINPIQKKLYSRIHESGTFSMKINNIGVFPNKNRPRVIWFGLEFPDDLLRLFDNVNLTTDEYGYKAENRNFSPHLTIGRIRKGTLQRELGNIGQIILDYKLPSFDPFQVKKLSFIKSTLTSRGPVYETIFEVSL